MSGLFVKEKYGQIPHAILNNSELSLKAKGLWVFIQSKPDAMHFSIQRIATQTKDGESAISAGLKELTKFGLLTRIVTKDNKRK